MSDNGLTVVPSDKTNRLVITQEVRHIELSANMLSDTTTYKFREQSKHKAIENQANKLVKTIIANSFPKNDAMKLISSGTKPAKFRTVIKDHKTKSTNTGSFPLRPIASTRNTPTDRIDWLVSQILNQLIDFVPAHLRNTNELLRELKSLENLNKNHIFISLDAVNLYPTVKVYRM